MNKPPASTPSRRACRGFSLTELMVTLAVLSTLLTLAIAGWSSVANSMKLTALSNTFLSQLHTARSEAIKRNASITLEQETGGWANGWSVKSGATVLLKQEAQATVSIVEEASGASTVTYLPTGRISSGLRFEITGVGTAVRCVSVDASGITSTKSTTC